MSCLGGDLLVWTGSTLLSREEAEEGMFSSLLDWTDSVPVLVLFNAIIMDGDWIWSG